VLRLAQQKEIEGAGIPGGCARRRQRAGEDVTNGAAARPVVSPREEEQRRRVREKGKVKNRVRRWCGE